MNIPEKLKPDAPVLICITNRCQSRCRTCTSWRTKDSAKNDELSAKDWKKALFGIHQWLGNHQITVAGGEPFIKEDIFEILKYAVSLGLVVNVCTNALNLTDKIERVAQLGLTSLLISLNSIEDPEIHNYTRGRSDAYAKTVYVLETLPEYCRKHDIRTGFCISMTVMPLNFSEIVPMAEFAKRNGISVSYQLLDTESYDFPTEEIKKSLAFKKEDYENTTEAINEMIKLKKAGYPINNSFSQFEDYKSMFKSKAEERGGADE